MTILKNIIKEELQIIRESSEGKWANSKYRIIKEASTTAKGNFGENFTNKLLNSLGVDSEIINGGVGDFDILVNKSIKLEHKIATEGNKNENFQFNHIRKDCFYDYAFCLGVTPDGFKFKIVPKSQCLKLTTHMTSPKKSIIKDDSYKLTISKKNMIDVTEENILNELTRIGIV